MPTLDELVAEYKTSTLNEREKAEFEQRIYTQATKEKVRRNAEPREEFIGRLLSIPKYESSNRQQLLAKGEAVRPLWERVIRDSFPVTSALTLARKAQMIAFNEHIPYGDALQRILAEYDAKPGLSTTKNGRIVKRAAPNRKRKKEKKAKLSIAAAPVVAPEEPIQARSARDTWRVIRQITENMLKERMAGCDPVFMETMLRDFRLDLEALIESYQGRIYSIGSQHRGGTLLPAAKDQKDKVNDACRELTLDEIEDVGDIIDITQARKNARAFLVKFHPDKNPGKDSKLFETKYKAVNEALSVLETYNQEHGVKINAGSN